MTDVPTADDATLPPCAPEAEESVISTVVLCPERLPDVRRLLSPEHFHLDACAQVYTAILRLDDAGQPLDAVTIASELKRHDRLDRIGGTTELARMIDATPAVGNVVAHAELVRDAYIARKTARYLQLAASQILHGKPWREALEELRGDLRRARRASVSDNPGATSATTKEDK